VLNDKTNKYGGFTSRWWYKDTIGDTKTVKCSTLSQFKIYNFYANWVTVEKFTKPLKYDNGTWTSLEKEADYGDSDGRRTNTFNLNVLPNAGAECSYIYL